MAKIKKTKKVKKSKLVKKNKKITSKEKLIGKVTHYFSDIKVGVIKLLFPLNEGDEIRITGGESTDFKQRVNSMQVDHKPAKKVKKGKSIGLKVKEKVRDGYSVYKIVIPD